jgi:DNA-binding response OmpR family regulator
MEKLSKAKFDVMLLDLKMPEMDGETVLKTIHTLYPDLGVIVLTAHATLESAIGAVKAGAVDYLLKPQKISDIEATIRKAKEALVNVMEQALSVLKEDNPPNSPTQMQEKVLHVGRLIIDSEQRLLTILPDPGDKSQTSTRTVELTEVQAQIMLYLATHKQQVIGSIEIAVKALGYTNLTELEAERIVRPHILRLRRKLETTPERPQFIRSVRGKGYCFSNYSPDSNLEDN